MIVRCLKVKSVCFCFSSPLQWCDSVEKWVEQPGGRHCGEFLPAHEEQPDPQKGVGLKAGRAEVLRQSAAASNNPDAMLSSFTRFQIPSPHTQRASIQSVFTWQIAFRGSETMLRMNECNSTVILDQHFFILRNILIVHVIHGHLTWISKAVNILKNTLLPYR